MTPAEILQTRILKCEHCQTLAKAGTLHLVSMEDLAISLDITKDIWVHFPLVLQIRVCFRMQHEKLKEACAVFPRDETSKKKRAFLLSQFVEGLRLECTGESTLSAGYENLSIGVMLNAVLDAVSEAAGEKPEEDELDKGMAALMAMEEAAPASDQKTEMVAKAIEARNVEHRFMFSYLNRDMTCILVFPLF